jgi:hypothetical protein
MDLALLLVILSFPPGDPAPGRCSLGRTSYRHPGFTHVLARATGVTNITERGVAHQLRFLRLEETTQPAQRSTTTDNTIWVIPWGHDGACRRTPWPAGQAWAPKDSVGVFGLQLLPAEAWHRGRPTFDAYTAELQPYSQGREGFSRNPKDALTATSYFDFLMALPTYPPNSISALPSSLDRWIKDHPDLRDRHPVAEILRSWGQPQ